MWQTYNNRKQIQSNMSFTHTWSKSINHPPPLPPTHSPPGYRPNIWGTSTPSLYTQTTWLSRSFDVFFTPHQCNSPHRIYKVCAITSLYWVCLLAEFWKTYFASLKVNRLALRNHTEQISTDKNIYIYVFFSPSNKFFSSAKSVEPNKRVAPRSAINHPPISPSCSSARSLSVSRTTAINKRNTHITLLNTKSKAKVSVRVQKCTDTSTAAKRRYVRRIGGCVSLVPSNDCCLHESKRNNYFPENKKKTPRQFTTYTRNTPAYHVRTTVNGFQFVHICYYLFNLLKTYKMCIYYL